MFGDNIADWSASMYNGGGGSSGGAGGGFGLGGVNWNSLGSGLGNLFASNAISNVNFTNPADAAQPYLQQIQGAITPYYQPYIDKGSSLMQPTLNQFNNLLGNPAGFVNSLGSGYQQSPGYQYQVNQATGAANRAGAASGMAGSPQEQQWLAGTVNNLANQDYYQYLNNVTNAYNTGLTGLTNQNNMVYNTGYGASTGLANNLAQALSAQAGAAYSGQASLNQLLAAQAGAGAASQGSGIGSIIGGLGSLLGGGLFGGGGGGLLGGLF